MNGNVNAANKSELTQQLFHFLTSSYLIIKCPAAVTGILLQLHLHITYALSKASAIYISVFELSKRAVGSVVRPK